MSTMHCSLLSLGCVFGFAAPQDKAKFTALRAFKIAQRRLRPEVRSKLLSASSARTNASLVPEAWRFVFLDPETSENSRVVTVAAKASSEHPDTIEAFNSVKSDNTTLTLPILQTKWTIDSDEAFSRACSSANLKSIQAIEYSISQQRSGQEPLWTIRFYADDTEFPATYQVGGKTGSVKLIDDELLVK